MSIVDEYNWARLREPFPANKVLWRVGNRHKTKNKATLLAYLDARGVTGRLDEVFGPSNWQNTYSQGPDGGVKCTLSVYCNGQWVHKEDGAENTQVEAIKGGYSGALKRAAVIWGVGRYLYDLDSQYHDIEGGWPPDGVDTISVKGHDGWGFIRVPELPDWARPAPRARPKVEAKHEPVGEGHDPSWDGDRAGFCAALKDLDVSITYDQLKQFCLDEGWPKPSAVTQEKRKKLFNWLCTDGGADKVLAWKINQERRKENA